MNSPANRRNFLKTTVALGVSTILPNLSEPFLRAAEPAGAKLDWALCCAAWSFQKLTFFDMLEKVKQLGLDHIEGFNWQRLSKQNPNIRTNSTMSASLQSEMRKRMADAGIKMDLCYIQKLNEESDAKKTFEWAKDLGVKTFVAEPPVEAYDMVEKLCDEYQINLAIHNHPAPSPNFDPATVAKACKGRGKRIGACGDTGHWVRSGFDPVEACKKLQGRLLSFHLKDVSCFGDLKAECVPWGTGEGRVADILEEMRRQKFSGYFSIEYEPYRPENFDKIAQCAAFFKKTRATLGV